MRSVTTTGRSLLCRLGVIWLCLCCAILAGCGAGQTNTGASATTAAAPAPSSTTPADAPVLEVTGPNGTISYTLEQLKAMPATEGYGGMKSSTGRITPPALMKGVAVKDLFGDVGGLTEDDAVGIIAKDGYEMTVSYSQIAAGDFLTYDMVTGAENEVEGPLQLVVAYEMDGQALDPDSWGTLRLCIVGPQKDQVTDGHWWVKWVTKLRTKPIEREWSLLLTGDITEEMDRAAFETGAAIGCHGREWKDAHGDTWTGVALYLLCGRVDDDNPHTGPAYNRELANAGYEVELLATDGATTIVNSATMYYNKDLIVAHKLNGSALPEEYWPLRLVGEGITGEQSIGKISEIRLLLPQP